MAAIEAKDGTRLYYADWGSGKPVVLIHGWAMNSDMWEYQIPHLAAHGARCIVYDQRGCGRSEHVSTGYDFDTLSCDLDAVLRSLDLQDVTLVGFSLAGGVIARFLTRFGPERVARTVLIGSNTPFLLKSADNPEGLDRSIVYEGFLQGLKRDRAKLLASCAPAFFGEAAGADEPVSPELAQWLVGLCHQSSALGMLKLYQAVNETDFRKDMAAFTMPTLVVHGDADTFQPIDATGRRTARAIAGSRLEVYPGASHGLFLTHRDRLNSDILAFVHELPKIH